MATTANDNKEISSTGRRKGTRLVLFPLPVQGHINPMLHLANALYSKGFTITIIHTIFNSPNPLNFPNFTFLQIPPDNLSGRSPMDGMFFLFDACPSPLRDALLELMVSSGKEIGCLISDALWPFPRDVADEFKLKNIVFRTSSLASFSVFERLPLLLQNGYFSLPDTRLEESVSEVPPLKVKDLPPKTSHELTSLVVSGTKKGHGIIWNSFEELEGPSQAMIFQALSIPSFLIGPLNEYSLTSAASLLSQDKDKDTIFSWLSSQPPESVIYVSFGSNSMLTEVEFVEIAWGLANSQVRFLWVVRTGMVQDIETNNLFPNGFLEMVGERGHIAQWAPQKEVLAHRAIGGFWTHCGWNSTIESISQGVPLICMPCLFPDQIVNAVFASEVWKIALRIEKGAKRDEIVHAIRMLMVDEVGEKLRKMTTLLKHKVDCCLAKGGSSYESLERLTDFILS